MLSSILYHVIALLVATHLANRNGGTLHYSILTDWHIGTGSGTGTETGSETVSETESETKTELAALFDDQTMVPLSLLIQIH